MDLGLRLFVLTAGGEAHMGTLRITPCAERESPKSKKSLMSLQAAMGVIGCLPLEEFLTELMWVIPWRFPMVSNLDVRCIV